MLATGFGVGHLPAPGTFGSLLAIPLFLAVPALHEPSAAGLALLAVAIAAAVGIAGRADRLLGEHDSGRIVVDEVAGMLVALAGQPRDPATLLIAFAAFRLLDIAKPWPAGAIDRRVGGGTGVVLDDVASGLWANLLVRAVAALAFGAAA